MCSHGFAIGIVCLFCISDLLFEVKSSSYMHSGVWRCICCIGEAIDDGVANSMKIGTREGKEHEDDKKVVSSGSSHGPNAVIEDAKLF